MSVFATPQTSAFARMADLFVLSLHAVKPRAAETRATGWADWLGQTFPEYVARGFAPHHAELWQWVWDLTRGTRPEPFVAIWPRGGAKSTSAELACVAVAALDVRSYALYVSSTQDQADKHVDTIASMLESATVERDYPDLGARMAGKYGNSRGWRRSRLRTASGFTIDAIGLDTAARGIKVEEQRPDFMVVDDIDQEHDSEAAIDKKIVSLTQKLLPAGAPDLAVLAIQNLVLNDGVFARLAKDTSEEGAADFLRDRRVSGPHPAIRDMETAEDDAGAIRIVSGTPTWDGMGVDACEGLIASMGLTAFMVECQHQLIARGDRIYRADWWLGQHRYDVDALGQDGYVTQHRSVHWDTAEEAHEQAAYSAGVVLDFQQHGSGLQRILVRDVLRGRWQFPELLRAVVTHAEQWRYGTHGADVLRMLYIENASSGRQLVQTLRREGPRWLTCNPIKATASKDARGREAAIQCELGRIWLPAPHPSNAHWLRAFEDELYAVPASRYRDQTDAFAHGVKAEAQHIRPVRIQREGIAA